MRTDASRFLEVGEHVVDIDTLRLLTRPDGTRLTPKAAAVLLQLVNAAGRTLSRDELLNEVWKGTCPTPDVLTQAVKDLRRALGDDLQAPRYIETLPRIGYRLVASARFVDTGAAHAVAAASMTEVATAQAIPAAATLPGRLRPNALGALLLAIAVALIGLGVVLLRKGGGDAAASAPRWHVSEQRAITSDPGPESFPRISPDGTRVAYSVGDANVHDMHIVQRSLEQSRVMRLTQPTPGDELYPIWSPDGAEIAFTRYTDGACQLLAAPSLGGPERLIEPCANRAMNIFHGRPTPGIC